MLVNVWDWMSENWVWIPLVISEIAALLPTKVNGIVQGFFRILNKIITKK